MIELLAQAPPAHPGWQLRLPVPELKENQPLSTRDFRSVELFTGAGGLAIGTHLAGFHHEVLVEWNEDACETLRANIERESLPGIAGWKVLQGDVRGFLACLEELAGSGIDLVAGGAPCQPFSIGGKHAGKDDPRNMLPVFTSVIAKTQPRAFILENVRGLVRQAFRQYFEYTLLGLEFPWCTRRPDEDWMRHLARLARVKRSGGGEWPSYRVKYRVVNAADYGVAQTRYRIFVVGIRSDVPGEFAFPEPTHSREALLYQQWTSCAYWHRHGLAPVQKSGHNHPAPRLEDLPWRTVRDAVGDLPPPTVEGIAAIPNHRLIPGARPYVGHDGSDWDQPSKTLKAGDHGVPGGENTVRLTDGSIRYYTVREAARIQGFPDEWIFEGSWTETMRQLGNAVPVPLAEAVARAVASHLARHA